ncbi:hypothetical protein [Lacisediminimonas sp.]|uniref:hypothetical protein n=1 Tax=Lacisediminimonas sp. TaxID=3060582 RepID=UPI002720685B|nr:hypothetical protein [Lacisediminimonas sp.]MDO8300490.1 hypothetical protein [Lacisediminimonas sp.]
MKLSKILLAVVGLAVAGSAAAKLPPPSEEAKAKAAAAKDKAGWADKVAGYQLCTAQDRVAARYKKAAPAKPGSAAAPACQNPGPYVATVAAPPAAGVPAAAPAAPPAAAAKK